MIREGDMVAVGQLIKRLGKEIESIIKSAFEISYYSRGAWSYESVLKMSQAERELAVDFINDRMKSQAKSMFPVY